MPYRIDDQCTMLPPPQLGREDETSQSLGRDYGLCFPSHLDGEYALALQDCIKRNQLHDNPGAYACGQFRCKGW